MFHSSRAWGLCIFVAEWSGVHEYGRLLMFNVKAIRNEDGGQAVSLVCRCLLKALLVENVLRGPCVTKAVVHDIVGYCVR
jgi:hypothetical protein